MRISKQEPEPQHGNGSVEECLELRDANQPRQLVCSCFFFVLAAVAVGSETVAVADGRGEHGAHPN